MTLTRFLRLAIGVGAINLAERAIGIVLGILLARWLGVDGYGTYAFVMAWVVILAIPAQFGLPNLLMRDLAVARSERIHASLGALLQRSVWMVLILSVLTTLIGLALAQLLLTASEENLRRPLVIGLCSLPALALLGVYASAWRGLGRPLSTELFGALIPTITVLFLTTFAAVMLGQGDNADVALLCRFIGLAVALTAAIIFLRRHLKGFPISQNKQLHSVRETLVAALPFMLITGANIIMSRTDIVMIGIFSNQRDVGLFNAGLQAALLAQFGLSISNSIVAPEFARLNANGEMSKLQYLAVSTARLVMLFGLAILAILSLFGNALLGLMFGAEFQDAYFSMLILVIGQSVALMFGEPGFLLNMTGNQTLTLRLVSGTALLNIALNTVLVPMAGIEGAALSTSISLVTWRALGYVYVTRRMGINCAVFGRVSS